MRATTTKGGFVCDRDRRRSRLTVTNSLIADNTKTFVWEDVSCNVTHSGTGTWQWPDENVMGEAERACASSTVFANGSIGALGWSGGPAPTIAPSNPALDEAIASGCAAADQNGVVRGATCTPGAVEMP